MKRFEENLYSAVCEVLPSTTVRSFSQALGMSDGYWSSIMAQGLKVSNAGLMHLHEYLESRIILTKYGGVKAGKLHAVQRLIAEEIVRRFVHETYPLDSLIANAFHSFRNERVECLDAYGAMPFVMLRT